MKITESILSLALLSRLCWLHAAENGIGKVRLIWHEDPSSHAVVAWDGDEGGVLYGKRGEKLSRTAMLSNSTSAKGMNNRFVHLKDLDPDQSYELEIRTRTGAGKRYWFRTAAADNTAFTFIAGGDSRNHHDARQRANLMVKKLRPLFVAFGGDMTNRNTNEEWQKWFDDWEITTGEDGRLIPIVVARGNHERDNESICNLFDVPNSNVYYTTSIGDQFFRLYTLNTEIEPGGAQGEWLKKDAQDHVETTWKLAQYHRPIRPHVSRKREGIRQYRAWAPVFYQYGFNLVMESDSHCVKVTWPVRPSFSDEAAEGFIRDDERGTVFAGEGCWGAPLRAADDRKPWTRDAGSFNQFKWIHVYPDRLDARTIPVDNVNKVGVVDDAAPFTAPDGLEIWQPENGPVVTVKPFDNLSLNAGQLEELKDLHLMNIIVDIDASSNRFIDTCTVSIKVKNADDGQLHYTLDGSPPTADSPVYSEALTIDRSCVVLAAWITSEGERSLIASQPLQKIELPEPVGKKGPQPDVYLDSLDWIEQSAGWGETQKNKSVGGQALRVAVQEFEHGLGMHSVGHVTYACKPEWKRLVASVGLGDHVRDHAQAAVQVLADTEIIYSSPKVFKRFDLHHINVAIPDGTKTITIKAGDGGNGNGWDNVNVVDAGFITAK